MSLKNITNQTHQYLTIFLLSLCLSAAFTSSLALASENNTSINRQAENLKKDLLELNKEMFILEEELLFPGNTQVAIFVSLDAGSLFNLDYAKVIINKKPVNYHLYTNNEIDSLTRGAVHRIHTTNLNKGKHELVIIIGGFDAQGREIKRAAELEFSKSDGTQFIELRILANVDSQRPEFEFNVWD